MFFVRRKQRGKEKIKIRNRIPNRERTEREEREEERDLDVGFLLEDFQAELRHIQENIRTGNF